MFADRALEFVDHRRLEPAELLVGHAEPVGFEVRLVAQADDVRDETQTALAALELAKQHVFRTDVVGNSFEIADVARLAKHRGIADDCDPFGIHLAEAFNDQVRQAGDCSIVLGLSGFIVEDRDGNVDDILGFWRRHEGRYHQPDRDCRERQDERNRDPVVEGPGGRSRGRRRRHRRHELETAFGNRLHEARIVAAVAQRRANLRQAVGDAAIEIDVRVRAPHRLAQLVAADDLSRPRQQQRQCLGRLRLERDDAAVLAQLVAVGVELEGAELLDHDPLYSTTKALMGRINIFGVLKGGLAAALIMNISQYLLDMMMGTSVTAPVAVVVRTTALGIATVWLYAAIRPRFGPGPKTAIWAGLIVWALSYVFQTIVGGQSIGSAVVIIAWTGVEMLVASSVGGYLYHES